MGIHINARPVENVAKAPLKGAPNVSFKNDVSTDWTRLCRSHSEQRQPVDHRCANEYLSGPLALSGMDAATANIALLLEAARKANRPVVHIRHLGTVGGMFDPQGERGEFIKGLEPQGDEVIIEKRMPNAFNDTGLQKTLERLGSLDVVCAVS